MQSATVLSQHSPQQGKYTTVSAAKRAASFYRACIAVCFLCLAGPSLGYQDIPTPEPVPSSFDARPSVESRTSYFDKTRNVRFTIEAINELYGFPSTGLFSVYSDGSRRLLKSTTTETWKEVIARDVGVILLTDNKLYVLDSATGVEKGVISAASSWCLIGESFQNITFTVWAGESSTVYSSDLTPLETKDGGGCFNAQLVYPSGWFVVPIEFPKQIRVIATNIQPAYLGGWKVYVPQFPATHIDLHPAPAHIDDYAKPTYAGNVLTEPYPHALPIVEYYNPQLHHYFLTINPEEQAILDADAVGWGWNRTGYYFWGWQRKQDAPPTALEVCRFYSPVHRTHFYTFVGFECELLKKDTATWIYEANNKFFLLPGSKPPDFDGPYSSCPTGSVAVHRLWNGGLVGSQFGTNHRFIQQGDDVPGMEEWIPEGPRFCAPT
jgi:hypothetical protein